MRPESVLIGTPGFGFAMCPLLGTFDDIRLLSKSEKSRPEGAHHVYPAELCSGRPNEHRGSEVSVEKGPAQSLTCKSYWQQLSGELLPRKLTNSKAARGIQWDYNPWLMNK